MELENTIEDLCESAPWSMIITSTMKKIICFEEKERKTYRIGDAVRVKVVRADVSQREIDFVFVE